MKPYPKWFEALLSTLFPPKLPRLHEWDAPVTPFDEQGACGEAQPRKYRDAIERHWAEENELDAAMERLTSTARKGRFDF